MAKVLGIGGVFLKAADPKAVREWYARVLGFDVTAWGGVVWPHPTVGKTTWSVFPLESDHFAPSTAPFMINFIVDDLEGLLARARAEGVEPVSESASDGFGKFGWLMDPTGVKIELWEPAK
ncbi:VOC family protein [Phenylobacterium sp.]|jgi:predicted enzyme related to lactoylglutathione lyase|uniref:VOC family protein n=1 Tax=Phenylobacterium sp. TaxID=1871053 RepID=UPI00122993CE|nr:VOC family protein [Phenylobacterium sp.]THD70759.1 MAG: VOC family protein [Phenylobacterium sp.]